MQMRRFQRQKGSFFKYKLQDITKDMYNPYENANEAKVKVLSRQIYPRNSQEKYISRKKKRTFSSNLFRNARFLQASRSKQNKQSKYKNIPESTISKDKHSNLKSSYGLGQQKKPCYPNWRLKRTYKLKVDFKIDVQRAKSIMNTNTKLLDSHMEEAMSKTTLYLEQSSKNSHKAQYVQISQNETKQARNTGLKFVNKNCNNQMAQKIKNKQAIKFNTLTEYKLYYF